MASNKTDHLQLNDWVGTDPIRREELNGNFRKLDIEIKNHADKFTAVESGLAETLTNGNGMKSRVILGVIRNLGDGNGFQLITTGGHTPFNISSIETMSDRIRVNYSFTGASTGSFLAVPDEVLAKKGFFMGSSVASSYADIMLKKVDDVVGYITKSGGSAPTFTLTASLSHSGSITSMNWVGGASKRLEITHEKCYNPSGVSIQTRDNRIRAVVSSMDAAGITSYIRFYEDYNFGATIEWNGTDFVVASDASDNTEITAVAWDAVNRKCRVTHIAMDDVNRFVNVSPMSAVAGTPPARPVISAISSTNFDVQFYDEAGALITSPNANCKFTFNRSSKGVAPIVPPDGTVLIFNRFGSGEVNPNDVIYPSSNIWLFGVMKV
jgi:hypothetical protein